jgi:hypothetical protein
MTLYNLSAMSPGVDVDERDQLLREAMRTSRFYRQAWYTHRALGASSYYRAEIQRNAGQDEAATALFREAAHEYRAALRRRPKIRFWTDFAGDRRLYVRFPGSPILHANAFDALGLGGQRSLARWHAWRAARLQAKRLKRAHKLFARSDWMGAYVNFDFAVLGRPDLSDAVAQVMRSVCVQQLGHPDAAAGDFEAADSKFPDVALLIRSACVGPDAPVVLPHGVPGPLPTGLAEVMQIMSERGFVDPPDG